MVTYKESFSKLEVFYNGKRIGEILREKGLHHYFMYYDNGHSADLLDEEIDKSKIKFERIIKQWEDILKT